jgi:hypothetical protein
MNTNETTQKTEIDYKAIVLNLNVVAKNNLDKKVNKKLERHSELLNGERNFSKKNAFNSISGDNAIIENEGISYLGMVTGNDTKKDLMNEIEVLKIIKKNGKQYL